MSCHTRPVLILTDGETLPKLVYSQAWNCCWSLKQRWETKPHMLVIFLFLIHGRHGPCHFLFQWAQTQYLNSSQHSSLYIATLMNWSWHVRWDQLSILGLGCHFQVPEFTCKGLSVKIMCIPIQHRAHSDSEWRSYSLNCDYSGYFKVHLVPASAYIRTWIF